MLRYWGHTVLPRGVGLVLIDWHLSWSLVDKGETCELCAEGPGSPIWAFVLQACLCGLFKTVLRPASEG
jgi:hypothetical protein